MWIDTFFSKDIINEKNMIKCGIFTFLPNLGKPFFFFFSCTSKTIFRSKLTIAITSLNKSLIPFMSYFSYQFLIPHWNSILAPLEMILNPQYVRNILHKFWEFGTGCFWEDLFKTPILHVLWSPLGKEWTILVPIT